MTETNPLPPDDEKQLTALLRTVSIDAPSPETDILARLRSESSALFVKSPRLKSSTAEVAEISDVDDRSSEVMATSATCDTHSDTTSVHLPMRASFSPGAAMKFIVSLTTVALAIVGVWFAQNPTQASTLKLGDVLAKLDKADVLQLEVTRDGTTATVWVRPTGMVRWEDSPTTYRIARGSRLWRIDETTTLASKNGSESHDDKIAGDRNEGAGAGEATFTSVDVASEENPWFSSDGRIDLIAMLNVRPDDRESLLRAKPAGIESFAGKPCLVFRRIISASGGSYRLEVFVDEKTEQLVGITARDPGIVDGPPLAEMMLVAFNPQVDDAKFRVPVQLAESDRIGKVTDTQGIVTLRPVGSRRWTPVCRQLLVQPGDWIRTDVRGANAATIELDSKVTLIVGPATLIEMVTPNEARLHSGTVQVARTKQSPNDFKLTGIQTGDAIVFSEPGKKLVRFDQVEKLTEMKGKPVWLAGYEGTSAEDSIGSLIVNVDGREQSLSVGEHHVTVEIRDQIARTTIEETFVNHTDSRLEGQFHFPLPQDASISGFGMWIAGELIEADIVEKQRAREIYETILREKRDPGLLEWTGGNIFKARVFPIEPHSEKRIKIVYTQVLPLRGNRFRYNYALKSELLQTNPLKSLNIRVLLNSAVPLAQVESPTHTCRTQLTKHSAELEFSAQEYTPTRDFELVCEVDHRENDLLVIPHRRGDDGYFLMQLMPPGADGQWAREVIPDGESLELLVLCDTSGSMDSSMRQTQEQFVTTLLTSLGEKDRFILATTDVETQWAFDDFVPSNDANIAKVREFLDARVSLGWTDLDQAFAAVLKKAKPGCQIVYVGDGIVSTVESDPAAFVNRLKALASGGRQSPDNAARNNEKQNRNEQQNRNQGVDTPRSPVFHSVSVGSSYESIVLKGIASLGGGSMRQISGETTPQETALELLNEIAQPGLKNVNVEFRGVRVAAVFPQQMPNIAAGTQQILVGRYLPQGNQQSGEVIVTGLLNGQPVKYVAKIELANAESGNSFIPRLWARGRLDSLLQEGSNQKIQDEIIELSEEFHIITPYTSLLVLETDADRERFGVTRRFAMRDGERFFADGRDNANYELQQQQIQRAGNWRLGLRRQLLAQLVGLGRDANAFNSNPNMLASQRLAQVEEEYRSAGRFTANFGRTTRSKDRATIFLGDGRDVDMPVMSWDSDGREPTAEFEQLTAFESRISGRSEIQSRTMTVTESIFRERDSSDGLLQKEESLRLLSSLASKSDDATAFDDFGDYGLTDEFSALPALAASSRHFPGRGESEAKSSFGFDMPADQQHFAGVERMDFESPRALSLGSSLEAARGGQRAGDSGDKYFDISFGRNAPGGGAYARRSRQQPNPYQSIMWVDTYFPHLAPAPGDDHAKSGPQDTSKWSPEAIAISESLLREAALREHPGGIEISRTASSWNSAFDRLTAAGQRLELWSQDRWLTRDHGQGHQSIVNTLDKEHRSVFSEAFLLGRNRKSIEQDFATIPLLLSDHSLTPLHHSYGNYRVVVETPEEDRALLRCIYGDNENSEVRFTIDTKRRVLLKQETLESGKVRSTTTHSEFVEVAGLWWATRIETVNADHPDRTTYLITQTITNHDDASFRASYQANTSLEVQTLFLTDELPSVRQAKQAVAAGTGRIHDHFILLLHYSISQKWEEAFDQLRAWETLADGKPGATWVRIAVEFAAARNEDARQRLVAQSDEITTATLPQAMASVWSGIDLFLAAHALSLQYGITGWNEYSKVVEALKPVFARQQDSLVSVYDWKTRWLQVLDSLGRADEAFALQRQMLSDVPGDVSIRTQHASRLNNLNGPDEALAFLKKEFTARNWDLSELNNLRFSYADILEGRGRYEEVLAFYEEWLPLETTQSNLFQRYLSALVMNDNIENADATVLQWLKIAERDGKLSAADLGKVYAAVQFCFGSSHNLSRYHYGMDRKWLPSLYTTARHCIERDDRAEVTHWILGNGNFLQSDEGDRLRGDILAMLIEAVGKPAVNFKPGDGEPATAPLPLPIPMDRLSILLEKLASGRLLVGTGDELKIRQVTKDEWTTIADALLKWWEATPNDLQKHQLSNLLTPIYARTLNEKHLSFLRRRVADGPKDYEASYRQELYNAVLNQPWTEEIETEAFALWPTLVPTEMTDENGQKVAVLDSIRTAELVPKLYHLIDTMLQRRITASQQALQDKGDVDATTRTERTNSAADIVKEAREGMANRLKKESNALGSEEEGKPDTLLRQWIIAERIYLDVLLDRNKVDVIKWAWAQLGDAPPKFVAPVEKDGSKVEVDDQPQPTPRQQTDDIVTKQLDTLLKQRAWVTAMNLAARRNTSEKLIERILDYIDAGIASGEEATIFINGKLKEEGADEEELVDFTIGWRRTKYNALILFDRPDELVTALKQWIAKDKWNIPWRRALAKLYAEKGELKDAIVQMESVEKDDELTPEDYASIADWYLVVDQREAYERSRIATYKAMQESHLGQLLNQRNSEIASGEGPHELDETTLFILKALFEKASQPSNYYRHVHKLYTTTRDFRLLAMIPESMLGQTKESVYASLSNLQSYLIREVRNEATADEILNHLHKLQDQINEGWVPRGADKNARSLALDLRALDLTESMIERKASEVLNQPGPHGKAAIKTFQRAFEQEWHDGERLQYARFLQQIGAVTHERNNPILTPLADEQLRQMRQLYDDSKPTSNDRVRIGLAHGQLLFKGYGKQQEGLTVLEAALNEFAAVHDGLIPYSHNDLVSAYSQMLQQMKQFMKAENYVQKHLDGLKNEGQRWTYIQHLNGLHRQALYESGRTSLGEDTTLFDNLLARLIRQCETKDDNQRYNLLSMIGNVFDNVIANYATRIPTAKQKLLTFANTTLQELLAPQQNNYSQLVQHFAGIIHNRVDALEAFSFLLDRFDSYPPRFNYGQQDAWQTHAGQLAQFRHESFYLTQPNGGRSDQRARHQLLEKRLLPIVIRELRNDLTNLRGRNQALYHITNTYFWAEKAGDFLNVAEDVLKNRKNSPRTITYVAEYVYRGLFQYARAIEVLFIAHRRGLLDDDRQLQLVRYLHEQSRYAESTALLEPIIERRQDEMRLRVLLIRAYYYSQRPEQLATFTAATDAHFHHGGRWMEHNVIEFARVLSETRQDQRASEYFEEAISLHQNTQPNRGIGTGTLSYYYQEAAAVYSRLGNDEKAVDAAAGGVVSWGNNQDNRQSALSQLESTIASVKNLNAFIKSLDAKASKTGEDSPLLRKMTGKVLQQRGEFAATIGQYRISLELQRFDRDVHQWMLECFDKLQDQEGATQQLLAQIDFDRHNLSLYKSLAERTKAKPALAERAATSIIEQAPNEAESHQALAEFRQEQNRWQEAIPLWKRVSELRKLEPTGLLGLAKAQIQAKEITAAKNTLTQLRRTEWPERFGDIDVQVQELERQIVP